jgi:hypothetical protein
MTEKLIGVIGMTLVFNTPYRAVTIAIEAISANRRRTGDRLAEALPRKMLTPIADSTSTNRSIAVLIVVTASSPVAVASLPGADQSTPTERGDYLRLCRNLNVLNPTGWHRNRNTILTQPVQMQLDRFTDSLLGLSERGTGRNAPRQVRYVCREVRTSFFYNNSVAHADPLSAESRLLQDTVERARSQMITWFAWHGHPAWLVRVLVLAMATAGDNEIPAIFLENPQHLGDLHHRRLVFEKCTQRPANPGNSPDSGLKVPDLFPHFSPGPYYRDFPCAAKNFQITVSSIHRRTRRIAPA